MLALELAPSDRTTKRQLAALSQQHPRRASALAQLAAANLRMKSGPRVKTRPGYRGIRFPRFLLCYTEFLGQPTTSTIQDET